MAFLILQQVAAKLPWGHTLVLIDRLNADNERLWYGLKAIENGWSRAVLEMQIETRLHARQAQIPKRDAPAWANAPWLPRRLFVG